MKVLLLNAGSSSLKGSLMEADDRTLVAYASADWAGPVTRYERIGPGDQRIATQVSFRSHGDAARHIVVDVGATTAAGAARPAAIGHRIVHGGDLSAPVRVTTAVHARIAALAELAPLHNPPGLEAMAAAEALVPDVPHVVVFDTAFHATLPAEAYTYPVPYDWTQGWGMRRCGFHGLSHAYCAGRAAELLGRPAATLRVVSCHLGHGCSATAVRGGRSIDTTMGFTPLDGLMMATRSGAVDAGILTQVQRRHGLGVREVDDALNRRSGLLGVSGISGDMREVLAARRGGHERARLAVDVYIHRLRQAIGALAVTMGGVDALVFTAGVGEHAAEIRLEACRDLDCLGLELDPDANASCRPDADVARSGSRGRILVIASREDLTMLAEVVGALAAPPADH